MSSAEVNEGGRRRGGNGAEKTPFSTEIAVALLPFDIEARFLFTEAGVAAVVGAMSYDAAFPLATPYCLSLFINTFRTAAASSVSSFTPSTTSSSLFPPSSFPHSAPSSSRSSFDTVDDDSPSAAALTAAAAAAATVSLGFFLGLYL